MKEKRQALLFWILAALPALITLCCLPTLPDHIPLHWNAEGVIDGTGSKYSAFFIPGLTLALALMMECLPRLDPKKEAYKKFSGAYHAVKLIFVLFMLGACLCLLYLAYVPGSLPMARVTTGGLGLLFCAIGNYMPKFKKNYFVGIKTPWALASETVWRKTHRLGGVLWFWGGLCIAALAFLLTEKALTFVLPFILVPVALIPILASYCYYRKEQAEKT